MGSLVGVHFWLKKKPATSKETSRIGAFIKGLNQGLRTQLGRYEDAVVATEDGRILIIGRDFEHETDELAKANIVDCMGNFSYGDCWDYGGHRYCYFYCSFTGDCYHWSGAPSPVCEICTFN